MKVRVAQTAFHEGARVRVGDVIDVADTFKASWFVPLESIGPGTPARPARRREAPVALSQLAKEVPTNMVENLV